MQSESDIERVAVNLLATQNLRLLSHRNLQSLWAEYGHICHINALDAAGQHFSLVLKYITPPHTGQNSSTPDEGHIRKLLSYQVELAFYTHLAPQLPPDIAVATCLASLTSSPGSTPVSSTGNKSNNSFPASTVEFKVAMLLTDLRPAFPVAGEKRATLTGPQVYASLDWLAGFHGYWWHHKDTTNGLGLRQNLIRPPLEHFAHHGDAVVRSDDGNERSVKVWLNGGYTYLATRRKEYIGLCEDKDSEWSAALCESFEGVGGPSIAELVARVLAPKEDAAAAGEYETLIHGDVKSENLFTNKTGDQVAFFDFQYVGLGLGVCDLAKLFTCSVPRTMLRGHRGDKQQSMEAREEKMLRHYLERLERATGKEYKWENFLRHWETALVDWLRFQASWGPWGNTEWLDARVRSILADKGWRQWLQTTTA